MKYLITERQLRVFEQFENKNLDRGSVASSYPGCVASETANRNRAEIKKTKSGQYFVEIYVNGLSGYQFYYNGRVRKPDGTIGNYSCGGDRNRKIFVDGMDIGSQEWNKVKDRYVTDWEKREYDKTQQNLKGMTEISPHTLLTIAQIGTAFIPFVGPFISMGIGLADAALYYKEGDTKTAGLIGVFSMLPAVGGLAGKLGLGKWTAKALGEIGKKISLGSKLSAAETQVANRVAQYRQLIQTEMAKIGENATVRGGVEAARTKLKNQAVVQSVKGTGKTIAGYGAAGVGYTKGYDYVQKDTPKTKSQSEGYNWDFVRNSFGSSGSEQENKLLNQAWDKGWRPGQIVPQEFRTKQYQNNYDQETQNINSLAGLIAQAKQQK